MPATASEIAIRPTEQPPHTPGQGIKSISSEHVSELVSAWWGVSGQPANLSSAQETVLSQPGVSAVSMTADSEGAFVAQDILGAVYGVGPSPAEAMADFHAALDDHLSYLRINRDALHPNLVEQLAHLEALFPQR